MQNSKTKAHLILSIYRGFLADTRWSLNLIVEMAELNSPCYQLPAVVTSNYKLKGNYEKLAGLDTCERPSAHLTGPATIPLGT